MQLSSTAFENNGPIPERYTCEGENINPPLFISGVPKGTKSYILLFEDPDSGVKTNFVHWLVYDIDRTVREISEGSEPAASQIGLNDFGHTHYDGPCPETGSHRYLFTLYALNKELDLSSGVQKSEIVRNMKNHVLAHATLLGLYARETS